LFVVCTATAATMVTEVTINWTQPLVTPAAGRQFTSVLEHVLRRLCCSAEIDFSLRQILESQS